MRPRTTKQNPPLTYLNPKRVTLGSEAAYDLIADHMQLIIRLSNTPLPKSDVISELGSAITLKRLMNAGVLVLNNGKIQPPSQELYNQRQEPMSTYFSERFYPILNKLINRDPSVYCYCLRAPFSQDNSLLTQRCTTVRQGLVEDIIAFIHATCDNSRKPTVAEEHKTLTICIIGVEMTDNMQYCSNSQVENQDKMAWPDFLLTQAKRAASLRASPIKGDKSKAIILEIKAEASISQYTAIKSYLKKIPILSSNVFLSILLDWNNIII